MRAPPLHALGWDCPYLGINVDLFPLGVDRLAGASCSQDEELERPIDHAVALAELHHEGRQFGIGQCGVVFLLRLPA